MCSDPAVTLDKVLVKTGEQMGCENLVKEKGGSGRVRD